MRWLPLMLIWACGEKSNDTGNADTNSTSENSDTATTSTEDSDSTDTDSEEGNDTNNGSDTNNGNTTVTPNGGSWTVFGPEFTTNTCGGGETFPESRSMTLGVNDSTVTMLIEAAGEHTYAFTCQLTDAEFKCEDIVIENSIPVLPCTLYYTHQLQGVFTDANTLEGDYTLLTTSSGGSGCSETNLGFSPPCEQAGTMTASFGQ